MLESGVPGQPVLHRAGGSAGVHRVRRRDIGRVQNVSGRVLRVAFRSLRDGYDAVLGRPHRRVPANKAAGVTRNGRLHQTWRAGAGSQTPRRNPSPSP